MQSRAPLFAAVAGEGGRVPGSGSFSGSCYSMGAPGSPPCLRPCPETILCLDLHQRGLGTGSCGPQTLDAYALAPGHYEFAFRLRLRPAAQA